MMENLNIQRTIKEMTIKEIKDFICENYYRRIRFTKENSYQSVKHQKKNKYCYCMQLN